MVASVSTGSGSGANAPRSVTTAEVSRTPLGTLSPNVRRRMPSVSPLRRYRREPCISGLHRGHSAVERDLAGLRLLLWDGNVERGGRIYLSGCSVVHLALLVR